MKISTIVALVAVATIGTASRAYAYDVCLTDAQSEQEMQAANEFHAGNYDTAFGMFNTVIRDRNVCQDTLKGPALISNELFLAMDYVGAAQAASHSDTPSYHVQTEQDFGYAREVIGWLKADDLTQEETASLQQVESLLAADGESS